MAKITREEVLKLAELSKIDILEEEIELVIKQLNDVLNYAVRVKEIAPTNEMPISKNINIFADDIIKESDSEAILKQAPDREDQFFVVPKILEN